MFFSVEVLNLVLYCVQQLGIALGLGAQTIMLVAYVMATRDGVVDGKEAQFLRATRNTLWVSLALVVLSGLAISALHMMALQQATVESPAYLFKSLLIVVVVLLTALLHTLPETFAEGLLGGTWYALFLVHILAPVTTWVNLVSLCGLWLVGFMLVWYALVYTTREKRTVPVVVQAPKPSEVKKVEPPPEPVIKKDITPPMPQEMPKIILERTPQSELKPITLAVPAPPPPMPVPPAPPVPPPPPSPPLPQIKVNAAPVSAQQEIEKAPKTAVTDTPFLPQVPPLQPIPTISNTMGNDPQPSAAGAAGSTTSEPADTIAPEIKLGLNVMPKSPDQLQK